MLQAGCGGSGYGSAPTAPTSGGGSSTTATVTIAIVGSSGSQAFSPNPAMVGTGQTFVFRNNDVVTHRIVADNGAFDTGNMAPGATNALITITSGNPIPFHCTIHPSMVGGINTAVAPIVGPGGPPPDY
jgi:plastocyanin